LLKNLQFSGNYHDENLSIHVTLENPADYGLEAASLVFGVTAKNKNGGVIKESEISFYIMDEVNHMYNTRCMPVPDVEDCNYRNEPAYRPGWLVVTDFKQEFLYQDLRVAFYYKSCQQINIIELNH